MNCLWCDQDIMLEVSWHNVIQLATPKQLCEQCEDKLEYLVGERCKRCGRISTKKVCADCQWWIQHFGRDPLILNHSVYAYNKQMQDIVAKWKYRGDFILANIFKETFIRSFYNNFSHLLEDICVVPIPLSEERLYERGFNQAKVLADFLPVPNEEIMTRVHGEKQAKMTRLKRISTENPFKMTGNIYKKVILVDDIYTTGRTLRHAASLLRQHGCPAIYAYTLIRG